MNPLFLPATKEEMLQRGWKQPDFVYVIGDAYVDHSSFGPAIISRVLEAHGFRVAILPQPDWKDPDSVRIFGEPRLSFLVSAGNMDSMVNHYTVNKKPRSSDAYSPGGKAGKRPDYATIVYCNLIRRSFKNTPVIIGGIEASLRRLAHYDYWSDKLRRSILLDSGADLLVYGMGELSIVEIAKELDRGTAISEITSVPGTVYKTREISHIPDAILLPAYDQMQKDRRLYAKSFYIQYCNADFSSGKTLAESYGEHRYLVQNPPQRPLTTNEMDEIYELPYRNTWHPMYEKEGGVPAIQEVKFSLTSNRGCFGGCSFCALTFHQGRIVQVRSHDSLLKEAQEMTKDPAFKGYIHDVGGPTANFRAPACQKQLTKGACPNRQCLFPRPCKNLNTSHDDYVKLLRRLRALKGVKKVFIRSGIRFDYLMEDMARSKAGTKPAAGAKTAAGAKAVAGTKAAAEAKPAAEAKTAAETKAAAEAKPAAGCSNGPGREFLKELCEYHISGQLRVAPEHVSDRVLKLMGKPENRIYQQFCQSFAQANRKTGKQQYIVPYLISSHPGSTLKDAIALAEAVRDMGYMPEQVQDFYPTPSTISTVMYYTGVNPATMQPVYVPSDPREKAMQRALIQYRKPENYSLVKEALIKEGRTDLIGWDRHRCLIPPRQIKKKKP